MIDDDEEKFDCWRCEQPTPVSEQYPMGLEIVCEGCYDG